jgi:lipoprotein-releasing system permease protein
MPPSTSEDNPGGSAATEVGQDSALSLDFAALPVVKARTSFVAEFQIAVRHLMSKKSDAMISIVAVLAVVGVLGSVVLVNVVMSVMTGFEVDLRDKILGANTHIVVLGSMKNVRDYDEIVEKSETIDGVEAAAPFVYTEMVIRSSKKHSGVILKGIDPDRSERVTALMDDLTFGAEGKLETAEQRKAVFRGMIDAHPGPTVPDVIAQRVLETGESFLWPETPREPKQAGIDGLELHIEPDIGEPQLEDMPGIIIGSELAKTLQVGPSSELQLWDPFGGRPGPMGLPMPRIRKVRVAGIYESGMYEYDNKWTYMANSDIQDFLRMGDAVTGVEVRVEDIYRAPRIAAQIDESLGPAYYARNWQQMNQGLFDALRLEKQVSSLVLFSTVLIACLLIVCVLTMMVLTKGREIAILRAMGASRWGILRVFIIEGMLIGLVGSLGGTALGLLACYLLDMYGWPLDTDVYFLNTLPVVIEWSNVTGVAVGAVVACFFATLYPAIVAARMKPVEGLRYE